MTSSRCSHAVTSVTDNRAFCSGRSMTWLSATLAMRRVHIREATRRAQACGWSIVSQRW